MSDAERRAYDRHIDNIMVENDILETKVIEGLEQGRAEGLTEGVAKANRDNARRMKADNMPVDLIAKYTGLTPGEIEAL
jgi:predicted transposase/invertase (TIGR01784 family)